MLTQSDLINPLILISLLVVVSLAYAVRVRTKGRAHFDRIERQGSSPLLSKELMEMAYWALQPIARFFVFVGVSPNGLSWLSLGFGVLAGNFILLGYFGYGAVLATVSAFLDSLDGMVARMTGVASDAGEVLDASIDRYVEFAFLGALVLYYRDFPWMQFVPLLAMVGSFMVSYSTAKAEALGVELPTAIMRRPERAFYLTIGAALSSISIRFWETMSPFPIGYPMVIALIFVAVLTNLSAIQRFYAIAQEIRRREEDTSHGVPTNFKVESTPVVDPPRLAISYPDGLERQR